MTIQTHPVDAIFMRLWTDAVDQPGYTKKDWTVVGTALRQGLYPKNNKSCDAPKSKTCNSGCWMPCNPEGGPYDWVCESCRRPWPHLD